jgi:hypothetical protein
MGEAIRPWTIRDVIRAAKAHDGRVVSDGCGGYEALAPDGCRWRDAEIWCYPIPLSEAEGREERQDMLRVAVSMIAAGVEPVGNSGT